MKFWIMMALNLSISLALGCVPKNSPPAPRESHEPRQPQDTRGVTPSVENSKTRPQGESPAPVPLSEPVPPGPSIDDFATFKQLFIGRNWRLCFAQDASSTRVEALFKSDGSFAVTATQIRGYNCTGKAESPGLEAGTYTLANDGKKGLYALDMKYNVGNTGQRYELVAIKGDYLYFGLHDDTHNASSPAQRPIRVNEDGYSAGEKLPITAL